MSDRLYTPQAQDGTCHLINFHNMQPFHITDNRGDFFSVLQTTSHSQVATMTISPGGDSGAYGRHEGDQVVYCIAGEGEIEIEGERTPFSTGEAFVIPAGQKHKAHNIGDTDLFFLNVYAPPTY